ncbi:hypothetical protein ANAPC5_00377 [Anaplasma phagocytophilum]|nr:hypothetical protein ANAPC2_00126 [Anaplasma phagocytophilum]SBO31161.1 hypothetical protein ANAPC4_00411 [Anaplasma phagocytophilum]SBO32401.1 hypothetical protein ANAPC3_00851 [Anaplasma phagocytophilum]SCV62844.1 hypothetical protein ANAPC5_00377 [Anaplasma phagocytophilum]
MQNVAKCYGKKRCARGENAVLRSIASSLCKVISRSLRDACNSELVAHKSSIVLCHI